MITREAQLKGAAVLKAKADQRALDILGMVKAGWSTGHMARHLGVHESSVRTIVHRARKRLGVKVR